MRRQYSSKSSLFLIEMILAILFFSIAAAVCTQAFLKAHLLSKKAENLIGAAQALNSTQSLISAGAADEISYWYDEDWNPCGEAEAVWYLNLEQRADAAGNDENLRADESFLTSGMRLTTYHLSITDKSGTTAGELTFSEYTPWQYAGEEDENEQDNK